MAAFTAIEKRQRKLKLGFTRSNASLSSFISPRDRWLKFLARIDEKGRITIPAEIRKTLGWFAGKRIEILFSVSVPLVVLVRGTGRKVKLNQTGGV